MKPVLVSLHTLCGIHTNRLLSVVNAGYAQLAQISKKGSTYYVAA